MRLDAFETKNIIFQREHSPRAELLVLTRKALVIVCLLENSTGNSSIRVVSRSRTKKSAPADKSGASSILMVQVGNVLGNSYPRNAHAQVSTENLLLQ